MRPVHLIRWGLPLAMTVGGLVVAFWVDEGVGEALVAAAVCVVIGNVLLRFGFGDADDREREEAARRYYDEHGRWPDEEDQPPRRRDG